MTRSEKLLAAFLLGAGIMHFVNPGFFDEIVPPWVPGSARAATYVSGVAETSIWRGIGATASSPTNSLPTVDYRCRFR